ncbi:fasciclin domain-containing protein, partial [Flavihumibacter sediminis]|nr:fasciclin domain-containing protein [Flavihumibacter sediminis]
IVGVAAGSADHSTLVAAVKAADLVGTLQGAGPFTVFAPTNAAFGKLPSGTVDGLLKPEAKPALTKILTYHVVAGKLDAAAVVKAIQAGGGKAVLSTVSGGKLTASLD